MTNPQASDKQAINEAISSWFEPKPCGEEHNYIDGRYFSLLGAWESHDAEATGLGEWTRIDWHPRQWDTDEAANARLLEAMPEPQLWLESNKSKPKRWGCTADLQEPHSFGEDADRKTAVLLAFCKFTGIEV